MLHHVKVLSWQYDKPIVRRALQTASAKLTLCLQELESEITYKGDATMCLETEFTINTPVCSVSASLSLQYCFAQVAGLGALPIRLAVSNIELHGTVCSRA